MVEPKSRDEICWFPMYVSYRRELSVKQILDDKNIENFVPMITVYKREAKKVVRREEPAIHNLIFVYSSINTLSYLKMHQAGCAPMQYMTAKSHDREKPSRIIIVEESKMQQFKKAMGVLDEDNRREFMAWDQKIFGTEGRRIRFVRGDFEGIEGTIKRVKKNRSLIITLKDVGVLVITINNASDIEFLD